MATPMQRLAGAGTPEPISTFLTAAAVVSIPPSSHRLRIYDSARGWTSTCAYVCTVYSARAQDGPQDMERN